MPIAIQFQNKKSTRRGARTRDPEIKSLMLYRLSQTGMQLYELVCNIYLHLHGSYLFAEQNKKMLRLKLLNYIPIYNPNIQSSYQKECKSFHSFTATPNCWSKYSQVIMSKFAKQILHPIKLKFAIIPGSCLIYDVTDLCTDSRFLSTLNQVLGYVSPKVQFLVSYRFLSTV